MVRLVLRLYREYRLNSYCCGKQKPTMSPLRGTPPCGKPKQGSRAKRLDSRFRGNDKYGYIRFPLLEGVFD